QRGGAGDERRGEAGPGDGRARPVPGHHDVGHPGPVRTDGPQAHCRRGDVHPRAAQGEVGGGAVGVDAGDGEDVLVVPGGGGDGEHVVPAVVARNRGVGGTGVLVPARVTDVAGGGDQHHVVVHGGIADRAAEGRVGEHRAGRYARHLGDVDDVRPRVDGGPDRACQGGQRADPGTDGRAVRSAAPVTGLGAQNAAG